MDVNKLPGFFNSIVPQIVAGNGSKSSNVQRSSNPNTGDTFVGKSCKAVSGQVLASASYGDIPVQLAGRHIGNTFKDFAKNLAA
jgi:hypothetical protein